MKQRIKNIFSLLFRVGLSVALLAYLFNKVDKDKMAATLKSADYTFILLGFLAFLFINLLILIRWAVLIRALDLKVPWRSVVNCYFIGLFFNLFLPSSTGGDLVKTIGLFKATSERAKVVATVILDRLSGFVSIVFVALVAFGFGTRLIQDHTLFLAILLLASGVIMVILILFVERVYEFVCRVFNPFPAIKDRFMRLHYAIVLLKKKYLHIFVAIGLSCLSQIILAFIFYMVARSLHQETAMVYFLIFVPLICVISSLPSIGGLGVRDAGTAFLFAKIGMSASTAVSISLINFSFMVVVGLIGGIFYVTSLSSRRIQHYQTEPSVGR